MAGAMSEFVVWRDPVEAWEENWTFVVLQLTVISLALAALVHAARSGSGAVLLWLAAVGHGLFVEGFCYWLPELDNFHHGKALLAIFGGRMPFYVVVLYPAFYYSAAQLASSILSGLAPGKFRGLAELGRQARLSGTASMAGELLATAALTGLLTAVVDIPYDVSGPKLLHWQWHPDDPNVFERVGPFVPVTSFIFHITFAASWLLAGVASHRLIAPTGSLFGLIVAMVPASLLPFPMGVLQIQGLYIVPHDLYCVPSTTCLLCAVALYVLVIAACVPASAGAVTVAAPSPSRPVSAFPVLLLTAVFALIFPVFAATAQPEALADTGVHLPLGVTAAACDETASMLSLGGKATKSARACVAGSSGASLSSASIRAGSRDGLPSLALVTDRSHCAMPAQPLPYRAVIDAASVGADGVASAFTMLGTAYGAEGPASTRLAMAMTTSGGACAILALVLAAWRLAGASGSAHKAKRE